MKNYDVIFFDMDDTLFNFTPSQQAALKKAFESYKLLDRFEDYNKSYQEISKVLWGNLEGGKLNIAELGVERFKYVFSQHGLDMDPEQFNKDYLGFLAKQAHLMEGAEKVIKSLAHKRLAVITNGFTKIQTSRVNHSALKGCFEQLIISEAAGYAKPRAEIFDYAFKKMQLTNKSNVLIVGDSLTSDIQGGINYGIDTCWYNPNQIENETPYKPTYEIHHWEELLEIIG